MWGAAKTTKELVVVVVMGHFLVIVLIIVGHCGQFWLVPCFSNCDKIAALPFADNASWLCWNYNIAMATVHLSESQDGVQI